MRALALAALLAGGFACRDLLGPERPPAAPIPTAPIAPVTIPSDADLKAQESVASHTQTITVNWDGSLTGAGDTGHTWYMETIYLASITGAVTAHGDPNIPTQTFVYGPCDPRVSVPFIRYSTPYNWNTHEWNACGTGPNAAYTYTYAYPSVGYAAFLMNRYYLRNCAPYTSMWWNCHTFSGGYTLTMTRVDADLTLAPSDTTIAPGGTAMVRWTAVPDTMGGRVTPVLLKRTFFEPAAGADGVLADSALGCASTGPKSCAITPQGAGTLHLWALVNGKLVHRTMSIKLVGLVVDAAPLRVRVGDSVSFSARPDTPGAWAFTGWTWGWQPADSAVSPDSARTPACPAGQAGCRVPVYESGRMGVQATLNGRLKSAWSDSVVVYRTFTLGADKASVLPGDTVTFTPMYDGTPGEAKRWLWRPDSGSAVTPTCTVSGYACRYPAQSSGTMWAYTSVEQGRGDSASVHVAARDEFALRAAPSNVTSGDSVTFSATLNRAPVAPSRWRWAPAGGGSKVIACQSGAPECRRRVFASGVMWAYRGTSTGEDSTGAAVTVLSSGGTGGTAGDTTSSCGLADLCRSVTLHIELLDGVTGNLPTGDTILVLGDSIGYDFSPRAGFRGLALYVDSLYVGRMEDPTLVANIAGTLMMNRDHTIHVASDPDFAARPNIADIRLRLRKFIQAGTPNAYAEYLTWVSDSAAGLFATADSLDAALSLASYLEVDPRADAAALIRLDDALGQYVFMLRSTPDEPAVTIIPPGPPPVAALVSPGPDTPTAASASGGRQTVFLYVNGIRVLKPDAYATQNKLRLTLGTASLGPHSVGMFWNPTARGELEALVDPNRGCAGLLLRDGSVRQWLMAQAKYYFCRGLSASMYPGYDDLAESAVQFVELYKSTTMTMPVADSLAMHLHSYHSRGANVIMVAHSQGNMMAAQAANYYAANYYPQLQDPLLGCTAVLSLASPIPSTQFPLGTDFLKGRTIEHDILLQMGLPNDFLPLEHSQRYWDSRYMIESLRYVIGPGHTVRLALGLRIHDVDPNYLEDRFVTPTTKQLANTLYANCTTLAP